MGEGGRGGGEEGRSGGGEGAESPPSVSSSSQSPPHTPLLRILRPLVRAGPGGHFVEVPGGPDEPGGGPPGAGSSVSSARPPLTLTVSAPRRLCTNFRGRRGGKRGELVSRGAPGARRLPATHGARGRRGEDGLHPPAHAPAASAWLAGRAQQLPEVAPTQGLSGGTALLPPGLVSQPRRAPRQACHVVGLT